MALSDQDGFIWYDGEMRPWREATTHVLSHSLHYGLSLFEGVRAYHTQDGRTAIFRLQEHTHRLLNSAKIYQVKVPFDFGQLVQAQIDVVRENQLKQCYIRPLIFLGAESLGMAHHAVKSHVIIAAWEWGAYLGEEALQKGIRVKTSSFTRQHVNASMPRAKMGGNYPNSILAHTEVIASGYDEALLLDTQGFVAEGSGENLFIIKDNKLIEPEVAVALSGITRDSVMRIAKDLGLEVISKRMTRDDIYTADEAFFCGTAAEMTPIRELDDRPIGQGQRGPITEKLQQCFFDSTKGVDKRYSDWLTYI